MYSLWKGEGPQGVSCRLIPEGTQRQGASNHQGNLMCIMYTEIQLNSEASTFLTILKLTCPT